MKDFNALKDLWKGQTDEPKMNYEDILKDVRKSNRSLSNKIRLETLVMLAGIILFIWIWLNFSFLMWTTHVSLAILISCCLYYVMVEFLDYKSLSHSDQVLQKPDEYIHYLKEYSSSRHRFNTRNYLIYSLFIGLAICLYSIEVYYVSPLWQTILAAVFTIGWFLVCWKLMIGYRKREQERLDDMINNLEKLKNQFH
ncbi:hypothetical protein [Arcticibacter eurypsychrophilus]|uniref:hypothetical protein n=1 Tax=Arcticibacter eurypsychrophilus TaxID=1434752 RepID=UPI00084D3A07|nr:hypothetical protein [Arcticibacter eurypsychrophilus]